MRFGEIYSVLYQEFGPQDWWPADSPFEVMVGAILTQNTNWVNVERALGNLKQADALDPTVITAASHSMLATWLRPAGYFNVKSHRLRAYCEWYLEQGGFESLSVHPTSELRRCLLQVHGIGPETADDILLYAFERPVFVIDAYTRRLFSRLGISETQDYEALRSEFEHGLPADSVLFNEFHALIVRQGKELCRSKPLCGDCCLQSLCRSYQLGG